MEAISNILFAIKLLYNDFHVLLLLFFSITKSPKDIVQMPIKGFLRTVEETVVSQILIIFISL